MLQFVSHSDNNRCVRRPVRASRVPRLPRASQGSLGSSPLCLPASFSLSLSSSGTPNSPPLKSPFWKLQGPQQSPSPGPLPGRSPKGPWGWGHILAKAGCLGSTLVCSLHPRPLPLAHNQELKGGSSLSHPLAPYSAQGVEERDFSCSLLRRRHLLPHACFRGWPSPHPRRSEGLLKATPSAHLLSPHLLSSPNSLCSQLRQAG